MFISQQFSPLKLQCMKINLTEIEPRIEKTPLIINTYAADLSV
jgi:hypothetical protein